MEGRRRPSPVPGKARHGSPTHTVAPAGLLVLLCKRSWCSAYSGSAGRETIVGMFDDGGPERAKLPFDESEMNAVQRLGRWMRIVGTIQLAFAGMALFIFGLTVACGTVGGGAPGLGPLLLLAIAGAFLFQALRIQAAGEQLKNLADEGELDYLELAFVRLKTVYVLDLVLAPLIGLLTFGGSL